MNNKSKNTKRVKSVKKNNIRKIKRNIIKIQDNRNNVKKAEIDKIFDDFRLKLFVLKQKQSLIVSKFLDNLKEKQIEKIKNSINF